MDDSVGNKLSYAAKMRIRGKLPQKREIVDWGNTKLHQFLKFVDFFVVDGKFVTDAARVSEAQLRAEDELFWDEFLERINVIPGKDGGTPVQFRLRLMSFARIPLSWIKSNPHAVTMEMLELMEKNPRMSWASKAFKVVETEMGIQVVERDNDELTDPGMRNVQPGSSNVQNPMVKFEQAKLSMLTLLQALGKSIPQTELKNMQMKDRIVAFNQLMGTAHKVMTGTRPNHLIFQQINVNKASREELEKSFIKYAEAQAED